MAQFNLSDELYETIGSKDDPNRQRKRRSNSEGFERPEKNANAYDGFIDSLPCRDGNRSIGNVPRGSMRARGMGFNPRSGRNFGNGESQGYHGSGKNVRHERTPFRFERNSSSNCRRPSQNECRGSEVGQSDKDTEPVKNEIPGFRYTNLKGLLKKSPNELVTYLNSKKGDFSSLLALNLRPDMVMLLVEIFAKSSATTLKENYAALLALSVKPNVLDMFSNHSFNITAQNLKYNNVEIINYFENLVTFYQDIVDIIPNTATECLQEYATKAFMGLTSVKVMKNVPVADDLELKYNILTASVKSLIELKKSSNGGNFKKKVKREWQPGIDFRELSIFPLPQDVLCKSEVQLCPLVKSGPYKSVEHYLDIQFNLMREDFLIPLREGISNFISQSSENKTQRMKRIENVRFYKNVRFMNQCIDGESLVYEIMFDPRKRLNRVNWRRSKRFLYGALLCFSNDSFRSLFVGIVKNRDVEILQAGLLRVELIGKVKQGNLFEEEFTMAESEVYFEAYQHVMKALQNFNEGNFPLKEYIINVSCDRILPNYLAIDPHVTYTFEYTRFPVLHPEDWPSKTELKVNDSQFRAIHSALTKKCVVIQGPPGTGKTYIGLIIAGLLLKNSDHWRRGRMGPILVVCFTNHALDQFLEGILAYTYRIIRVGGQSKNENLNQFNLRCLRKRGAIFHHALSEIEDRLSYCTAEMNKTHSMVKEYLGKVGIISLEYLQKWMMRAHYLWFTDKNEMNNSLLVEWLLAGAYFQQRANIQLGLDDVEPMERNWMYACNLHECWANIIQLGEDVLSAQGNEHDYIMWLLATFRSRFVYLKSKLREPVEKNEDLIVQLNAVLNLNQLSHQHRWVLYDHWVTEAIREHQNKLYEDRLLYQSLMKQKFEIREAINLGEILDCDVVGMTTTGAAKHQGLLQKLGSRIVIVEEAAEVLESHVISSLSDKCEHLILIGDHKQLRPAPAVYKLAKDYNLEISLFERMLLNNIDYDTLLIQHRMRPDIADLIIPAIYPTLENHSTVMAYDKILGLQKNLYFIHHNNFEQLAVDDTSKKNTHEAEFLIALCRHIVLQGYDPSQITILTTYTGQMFCLMEEKEKHSLISGVRITVVDNFQGEENDIILLSLVRNNEEGKIGFLGSENRTCVALSRAKKGLYIIGNIDMLSDKSPLWSKIHKVLQEKKAVGSHLTLKCLKHPEQLTDVNKAEDFISVTEGGCKLMCSETLSCGHMCKKMCHARSHEGYKCYEICNRVMCIRNHMCKRQCWETCGDCMVKVDTTLPCGHETAIPCHIDPSEYKCRKLVSVTLPDCEHTITKECNLPIETAVCSFECDTRLPCGHKCEKKCHVKLDPDHLDYKCLRPCGRKNLDCKEEHVCQRRCHEECSLCTFQVKRKLPNCDHFFSMMCSKDPATFVCQKPCKKKLDCGHSCRKKCFEMCGDCPEMVDKEIPDCKHVMKMKCCETPVRKMCRKKCERTRTCGHPCNSGCGIPCHEKKCETLSSGNARASCGHQVRLFCFENNVVPSPETLMKRCLEPCPKILECTHRCKGSCGQCMQGRIHVPCEQRCGKNLICGHECTVSCSESCPPCRKKCFIRCEHTICRSQCGKPCSPCQEQCGWKCEHQKCLKRCGELCDRPPCNEPCKKKLEKCGHPCIGFCGERCPTLCRICDPEEVDDILTFLGSEDDENARFIVLPDCDHVLEATGLDKWIAMESNNVKMKACPKCTTPIQGAYRYGNVTKQHFFNVLKVKEKIFGSTKKIKSSVTKAAENLCNKFRTNDEIKAARSAKSRHPFQRVFPPVTLPQDDCYTEFIENAEQFGELYKLVKGKRVRYDVFILNSLEARTGFIASVVEHYDELKLKVDAPLLVGCHTAANMLIKLILRRLDFISPQERSDLEGECIRFHLMMQLRALESTNGFKNFTKSSWFGKYTECKTIVDGFIPLRKDQYQDLHTKINGVYKSLTNGAIGLSNIEMREIVGALNLHQGHWKICPNGHVYVVGDCGGAVMESRCNECGERIGGSNHQLLGTNRTLQNIPVGI